MTGVQTCALPIWEIFQSRFHSVDTLLDRVQILPGLNCIEFETGKRLEEFGGAGRSVGLVAGSIFCKKFDGGGRYRLVRDVLFVKVRVHVLRIGQAAGSGANQKIEDEVHRLAEIAVCLGQGRASAGNCDDGENRPRRDFATVPLDEELDHAGQIGAKQVVGLKPSGKGKEIVRRAEFETIRLKDRPKLLDVHSEAIHSFLRVQKDGHGRFLDADCSEIVSRDCEDCR